MTEHEDDALVQAIVRRDPDALADLYDRYGRLAFGLAYRILNDASAAEEVVQDAFLRTWQQAASFNTARGTVRTWLLTIVHHRAIDVLRGQFGRRQADVGLDAVEYRLAAPDVWGTVVRQLQREQVQVAVWALPDDQRQAIELAYFAGLTHNEIAERTGVPLGTVKSRLRLGLHKLHDALASAGTEEAGGSD